METGTKSSRSSAREEPWHQDEDKRLEATIASAEKAEDEPNVSQDEEEYVYVTGFQRVVVIASVTLVAFLLMLDMSIIVTAIPRITSDFHSLPDVGWYGSVYQLANASLQPLTGKLYTYFSSKWTFLSFFALFELGSLLCGVAQSSTMLIVGRAVAGLGSSGLMNGALTIITACVPLQERPMNLGIMMGIAQLGIVFGPLVGGALTTYTTWRWCFYINLPIGAIVAILLFLINIPDRTIKGEGKSTIRLTIEKLDLTGFVLFTPASIQFLLALQWGGDKYRWGSTTIIGLFCGAGGTFAVFLAWEYRKGDLAMIPFSMVRKTVVWCSCTVMFFFMGMLMCVTYYLPIYFQAVRGVSPMLSGVYVLPNILSQMVTAISSGILVSKLGYYLPWILGSAALSAIGNGLLSLFSTTTSTGEWIGFQIIVGVARGAGMQMPLVAVQNNLPQSQVAISMSVLIFSQTMGGAIFLTFAETVFSNSLVSALAKFAPTVNAETVVEAGATAFRGVVAKADLGDVLKAYSRAVDYTLYLAAGAAVACFCFAWGMGWKDIRKTKENGEKKEVVVVPQNV